MAISLQGCTVCGQRFEVSHGFQVQGLTSGAVYFCSQRCHEEHLFTHRQRVCSSCGGEFELQYAFQQLSANNVMRFFCSTACRQQLLGGQLPAKPTRQTTRLVVLNQKGGTGKTTTAVNLAAGLAETGSSVLLIDLDAQGHVAASLGGISQRGIYQVLIDGLPPQQCLSQLRKRLHALIGDEYLAQAELLLAQSSGRKHDVLSKRLRDFDTRYDFVIIDGSPAMSLLNLNALYYAEKLLIPVSCDYLSLVGVKQMLRSLERIRREYGRCADILGIVPTFYDRRNRISDEAVKSLRTYFRDKVLPPIRVNTRIKEAPQHDKSIFEYSPDSRGAQDYARLVAHVREVCTSGAQPGVGAPPPADVTTST